MKVFFMSASIAMALYQFDAQAHMMKCPIIAGQNIKMVRNILTNRTYMDWKLRETTLTTTDIANLTAENDRVVGPRLEDNICMYKIIHAHEGHEDLNAAIYEIGDFTLTHN